jgi:hypothetical protein
MSFVKPLLFNASGRIAEFSTGDYIDPAMLPNIATPINFGTATFDFGSTPGSNEASIAVTGLTAILSTSNVTAWVPGDGVTANHTAADHKYLAMLLGISVGDPTAATGFTIYARSLEKITGLVTVNYSWV